MISEQDNTPEEVKSRVTQMTKAIRYKARKEGGNLFKAFNDYMGSQSGISATERAAVKQKLGLSEVYSSWRDELELREVASKPITDNEMDKTVKEKKVKNKVTINPSMQEAVEELGGTILEVSEYDDDIDYIIESTYDELIEEGYSVEDVEEAIEYALTEDLNEASDKYYGSAVKASKKKGAEMKRAEFKKKAVGRIKSLKNKVGMASAKAQVAAYNKGREAKMAAGDKIRKAKQSIANAPKDAKSSVKSFVKKQAQKVVDRMSEEVVDEQKSEVDPVQKKQLQMKSQMMKKQQMLDRQRLQAQKQGKIPMGHGMREESELEEKVLDKAETDEKERIVKGMKKKFTNFKDKYGKDAKSVMYATATKMAKKHMDTSKSDRRYGVE